MQKTVIKPGLLVSLSVRAAGGVTYHREEIEAEHQTEQGTKRASWQTEREILAPAEFEAAGIARGAARAIVSRVCCRSTFGLLCPTDKEPELTLAVEEARRIAQEHNQGARHTRVEVFVMVGRIAQDDVEAARAIAAEVRALMAQMAAGIKEAKPEAIREAADKARALAGMLTPDNEQKVSDAIAEARKAARIMVKRIEKAGEPAARVVADLRTQAINAARFAFLDTTDADAVEAFHAEGRALDLEPEAPGGMISAPAQPQFALEVA